MPTIDADRLDDVARRILVAAGTPDDIAQCVAESLVEANLKGVDSHGVEHPVPRFSSFKVC